MHSWGEGAKLVETNKVAGEGLYTLRALLTETLVEGRCLGVKKRVFR